jgi:nucleotide-binding universal stress UspA family protein
MLPIRTILHPTDFSEPSEHACRLAASLARDQGARLVLLHVVSPTALTEEMSFQAPADDPHQPVWEAFGRLESSNPCLRDLDVRKLVEVGDPLSVILRTAQDSSSDLIVMGTHGRTGLSHLLMGSVAEQVVRKATCPVLTVKTPLHEGQASGEAIPEKTDAFQGTASRRGAVPGEQR